MAGQLWATGSLGGYLYSLELSDTLRNALQPLVKFRQFADAKDFLSIGQKHGQVVTWDVVSDVATQGTTLVETATIPVTNVTISQGTGTVYERANSIPYTGMLDSMSKFEVEQFINKALKNDAKKSLDQMCYDAFNTTPLRVVAAAGTSSTAITLTTNGTATLTNNVGLGKGHVRAIGDLMLERNIPPFVDDDYVGMAHPTTLRPFMNDLESVQQYTATGFGLIMNGEVGRYESFRFVRQTNIAKAGWTNGQSNQAMFLGQDTVAELLVVPEEIRAGIPSDMGRSKVIGWYYLGGAALVRTVAAQATVVKWDSAA